jgi:hypothetical protein
MSEPPIPGLDLGDAEVLVRRRLGGRVLDLRVTCREGRVVVQGVAVDYHTKQLAQHIVFEVLGRPPLTNEIRVCPRPAPGAEDDVD